MTLLKQFICHNIFQKILTATCSPITSINCIQFHDFIGFPNLYYLIVNFLITFFQLIDTTELDIHSPVDTCAEGVFCTEKRKYTSMPNFGFESMISRMVRRYFATILTGHLNKRL